MGLQLTSRCKNSNQEYQEAHYRAMIRNSQQSALGSLMFNKHFKQILVRAHLDVHLTDHAEVKQSYYVTEMRRILINSFINQISEVGEARIHNCAQAIPPTTHIGSKKPKF